MPSPTMDPELLPDSSSPNIRGPDLVIRTSGSCVLEGVSEKSRPSEKPPFGHIENPQGRSDGRNKNSVPPSLPTLPLELRRLIYTFVLAPTAPSRRIFKIFRREPVESKPRPPLRRMPLGYELDPPVAVETALLRTSKAVYHEALPFLYVNTTFVFAENFGLLPGVLGKISDAARRQIQSVRISFDHPDRSFNWKFHWDVTCAQIATSFPGLRLLEIVSDWTKISDGTIGNDFTKGLDRIAGVHKRLLHDFTDTKRSVMNVKEAEAIYDWEICVLNAERKQKTLALSKK